MTKTKYMKIENGDFAFKVKLKYEKRKTLKISVLPTKKIEIKAPEEKSEKEILKYLIKKSIWIQKQLNYFDKFHPLPEKRLYKSGETHLYLGKQYRLKISQGNNCQVKLIGGFFFISVNDKKNPLYIQKELETWYRHHALIIIQSRLELYLQKYNIFQKFTPEIKIKKMKKRWGSFSRNHKITLNLEIIKTPVYCIDYVIVHELCHLISPDHGSKFYKLLSQILPDWEKRKEKLEKAIL